MKEILFVCTGNLCRSPLAEGYFNALLRRYQIEGVHGSSAGTHAMPGALATPETCEVARRAGFDLSNHQARPLSVALVEKADLVCTMERLHKNAVLLFCQRAPEKVELLTAWLPHAERNREIEDPYMQSMRRYEASFRVIATAIDALFRELFPTVPIQQSTF